MLSPPPPPVTPRQRPTQPFHVKRLPKPPPIHQPAPAARTSHRSQTLTTPGADARIAASTLPVSVNAEAYERQRKRTVTDRLFLRTPREAWAHPDINRHPRHPTEGTTRSVRPVPDIPDSRSARPAPHNTAPRQNSPSQHSHSSASAGPGPSHPEGMTPGTRSKR